MLPGLEHLTLWDYIGLVFFIIIGTWVLFKLQLSLVKDVMNNRKEE